MLTEVYYDYMYDCLFTYEYHESYFHGGFAIFKEHGVPAYCYTVDSIFSHSIKLGEL